MNILLGVTGSVAASLTPKMVAALKEFGEVRVVMTQKGVAMAPSPPQGDPKTGMGWISVHEFMGANIYTEDREWPCGRKWQKGDPVLHIDLKNWADVLILAPCTANTLAKIAIGMADNLLTNVVRAWPAHKPFILAPAMNTDMWENRKTHRHLDQLRSDYYPAFRYVPPQSKQLACGDTGTGAMADISEIVGELKRQLAWVTPLRRKRLCGEGGPNWTPTPLFIPELPHPGAFGAVRKHDVHTGVDLYAEPGWQVQAMEPGIVVGVVDFTGSKVVGPDGKPMDWWHDTQAVLVKGASGVIVYGEISPTVEVGTKVHRETILGTVIPVLPDNKRRPDIPHHSTSMLHIELYTTEKAATNFRWKAWEIGDPQPEGLLDPTPQLRRCLLIPC